MSFSDYRNVAQVQKQFQIKYQEKVFVGVQNIPPPPSFIQEFEFTQENIDIFTSEGSRSEAVIFPILREAYKPYYQQFTIWIQKSLVYNDKLSGTPDYIIARKSPLGKTVLETPLVLIGEAKKNDFEQGWGQCLAELVAAQKMNENTYLPVFGIVTDGKLWEFGKLEGDVFTKDPKGYTVDDLGKLFGVLNFIFQSIVKNISSADDS